MVDVMAGDEEARSVGRPRDEDLSRRILTATREQLRDVGFAAFRVNDVASALGCGVSSIYRRWSTREHLMTDAIATRPALRMTPIGEPLEDLRSAVVAVIDDLGLSRTVLSAAMDLVQADDEFANAIHNMVRPDRQLLADSVAAVLGDDHTSVPFIVDAILGIILFRSVLMGEELRGPAIADEVLDLVRSIGS